MGKTGEIGEGDRAGGGGRKIRGEKEIKEIREMK